MYSNSIFSRALGPLAVAACLFLAATFPARAQEHSYMEQLSVDEGLPHTDVSAIVQDKDGYIWIGTYSGLCRYDGNSLTVWDMSNSILESSRIRALRLVGSLLYVGTENGGLTVYDTGNDAFLKTLTVPTNCVNSIFPSKDGESVWICTNDGVSFLDRDDDGYSLSSWSLGCVCSCGWCLGGGEVLVGTNTGIGTFDIQDGFRLVSSGVFATSTLELSESQILMTAYEGCFVYETGAGNLSRISSLDSRSACLDGDGGFYVGTEHAGVLRYGSSLEYKGILVPWNSSGQTSEIDVSTLLLDKSMVLWIGTNGSGCFKSTTTNRAFGLWEPFRDKGDHQLVTMYSDSKDRLWVTSRDGSVAVLSGVTLTEIHLPSLRLFSLMPVSAVYESVDGAVWLGSWDYGVGVIPASDVDAACSGRPFRISRPSGLPERISVYKFAEDDFGSMWITTSSGVLRSECASMESRRYMYSRWTRLRNEKRSPETISDDFTTDISVDGNIVWIGTRTSLNRVVCGADGEVSNIDRVYVRGDSSAGEFISFIHHSADDSLWVSVLGLGLAKLDCSPSADSLRFRIYDNGRCPDFPNNEFESVQEDSEGNLWMGGLGLVRFNPKTLAVKSFSRKDGLQSNAFKIWDSAKLRDGRMAFGGINGFNLFRPESISDNPVRPKVCLTGLKVNGEDILSGIDGKPLRSVGSIELKHDRNNLVFSFSSMHYVQPQRNTYSYMMRGIDESPHETTGRNPFASYLNLRPGRYVFEVYGSNSDGLWGTEPASLSIRILPPWYASVPAIIAYILVLMASCVAFVLYLRRRSVEEHRRELEGKLREEERERNENELKFHADFLHEIRTPLTLITTPVEELLKNPNLGKTTLSRLRLVDQSAKILQKHIEYITDLRKYDHGAVRLHVVQVDFSRFVEEICLLFQPVAKARGYEFSIETSPLGEGVYLDKDSIEKVILNLMSNAVKYSPERGGR